MRVTRLGLRIGVSVLALTMGGCAPIVNQQVGQQSGQATSSYQPPAPVAVETIEPTRPAAESTRRVGVLLPLSGPQAALGQNLLDAAQLATYDLGNSDFALIPVDTKGTPEGAAAAARQALQDGAGLLVGPVFSAEVDAVKAITVSSSVSVLTLSNNSALADGRTFVLGFTPTEQVTRILSYAQTQGLGRVAALLPASPYGDRAEAALLESAPQIGLTVVKVQRYQPNENPVAIATSFAAALGAAGGADGLLMVDASPNLAGVLQSLSASGLDLSKTRLLGTSLWEDQSVARLPQLSGAWYAAPAAQPRRVFAERYSKTYGAAPAPIATLVYDAVAMAAVLARSADGSYGTSRLTDSNGFAGSTGVFRLQGDGQVEHGLEVREIGASGAQLRDPAPTRFATTTN